MSLKQVLSSNNMHFVRQFEDILSGSTRENNINMKAVLDDIFSVAVDRGLNDEESSVLLKFCSKSCISSGRKTKLLSYVVPNSRLPKAAMTSFMVWFISHYNSKQINKTLTVSILQWIIGLIEHNRVDPSIIDIFYYDLFTMLSFKDLVKYVCKLLCTLTKPEDVTASTVRLVTKKLNGSSDDKYLFAVLNVFKGYKSHLVPGRVRIIDVNKVLMSVPQKMDTMLKVASRLQTLQLEPRTLGIGVFRENIRIPQMMPLQEGRHTISSLLPFPTYNLDNLDKMVVCYPNSIKEAFKKFGDVPIPQNVISLLRDETGFFIITYSRNDLQKRFSVRLQDTLLKVFIYQEQTSTEEDKEFLLSRVYQLQMFMQQGMHCVSIFLSGYLINWDGLDHRSHILSLIEWASFDSYRALYANILRPLYLLFVSYDVTMKNQIIQTITNLIRNMYVANVGRADRELPYPFLQKAPVWTNDPMSMLTPLVQWAELIVKIGLCLESQEITFLAQCVNFYEVMNMLETRCSLPIWTVVSRGVVYRALLDMTPITLGKVCRLLLRYHTEFLPQLHSKLPDFYNSSTDKINLTTKFAQELINFLWTGQAQSRKEDGILMKLLPEDVLQNYASPDRLDKMFDLEHHAGFMPFVLAERANNGLDFMKTNNDFLMMMEYHIDDIAAFIKHFSPG